MQLKRLNYFKGQFLKAQDFKDEQQYHIENFKKYGKNLYTWGILKGLAVEERGTGLLIKKGAAIDSEGRVLVLSQDEVLGNFPGKFFYVVLFQQEKFMDNVSETGISGDTRILETAEIKTSMTSDPRKEVVLAKVIISEQNKAEIDTTLRRYSGIPFFSEGDDGPEMTGKIFESKEYGKEYGIYCKSSWLEVEGRIKTLGLKVSGNAVLGEQDKDDSVFIFSVVQPRRSSNKKLPPNSVPGSKLQVSGDIEFQQILTTPNDMIITSAGDISLISPKGVYIKKNRERSSLSGNLAVEGDITVSGKISAVSKQFVIQHPLDPQNKCLVHSTLEGPELAVFYRGEAQLNQGEATIELPSYFEALTQKQHRTVLLTPIHEQGSSATSLSASHVKEGKFTVKTIGNCNPSQKFYWEVKAIRADMPELEVETKLTTCAR